jgi:hypothetical protein
MDKKILSVGKYSNPADSDRCYFVMIEWFEDHPPVEQPVDESALLELINKLISNNECFVEVNLS